MTTSSQKFIARNRAPRVQIEYDVELYGSQKKIQLPFVMGVMSDLAGKSTLPQPAIENRKFLEIDVDNFDDRMRAMQPRAAFSVPNTLTGEGNLDVDLTFEKMEDFTPQAIAARIAPLRSLLEARTQLSNLMTYMDGKVGAETLIEKILADPSLLSALAGAVGEDGQTEEALDSLRSLAVDEPQPEDRTGHVLDALRSGAAVETSPMDTTGDILAGLAQTPVTEDKKSDTGSEVLDRLRSSAPAEVPEEDDARSTLDGLRARTPEEEAPDTGVDDALAALAATAPTEEAGPDKTAETLTALAQMETPETPKDTSDDTLAGLAAATPEEAPEPDDVGAALDSLAEVEPETPEIDSTADTLAGLAAATPEAAPEPDDVGAALDSLGQADINSSETKTTDDTLADLADATIDDTLELDELEAALDSLSEVETEKPETERTVNALAELAPASPSEDPDTDDLGAALDSLMDVGEDLPPGDINDDMIAEHYSPSPAEAPKVDNGLDDLEDLLAADEATPADEVHDDLDDLLAEPGADDAAGAADPDDDLEDLIGSDDSAPASGAQDDLDDLLSEPVAPADDLDDLLGDLDISETQEEPAPTTETAGILAEAAGNEADALDGLSGVSDSSVEPTGQMSDDAELDDLLGDLDVAEPTQTATEMDDMLAEAAMTGSDGNAKSAGELEFAFGLMSGDRPAPEKLDRKRFRIALMGDFSGRAARGQIEIGDALAARKPILLDPDTIEDVIAGFGTTLVLPIGKEGAGVEVRLDEFDDLHPDELYEKVALLYDLKSLKSQLASGATSASAAERLKSWGEAHGTPVAPPKMRSGGNAVPANLKLTEFQKLIGDTGAHLAQASPVEDMIARIVGPHVRAVVDNDTVAMQKAVDAALSSAMRLILHHPEFQSVEAQWRSLDLIARSIETDDTLEVMLYDISAEEIAADLAAADDLSGSGLVRLLTDSPMDPETGRGGYSALFGLYTFEETPPHAELLGRIGRVAAHVDAPFLAALSPGFLETAKPDRHPLVAKAWDMLRAMPEAGYLGLASPRFLLRRPYGAKSEPIYAFEFEEFTMSEGLKGMLWANPVVLVMILMAKSFKENGAHLGLGSIMSLGDMPYHFVTDRFGDQVALPCTERNLTLDTVEKVMERGVMPVVSIKGRDEIRLASFQSLGGGDIRGPWSDVPPPPPSPPKPESAPMPEPAPEASAEPAVEDDLGLDDLLAGFDDAAPDAEAGDVDADLAALLEDL
jgi:pilus assembly protein FimV